MSHNPLAIFYHRRLDDLAHLSTLAEEALTAHAEKMDAELAVEAEKYTDDEKQEFYEYHAEDYHQLANSMPTLLRYSILTGADSGLEAFLNDTCETFAQVHDLSLSLKDLHGRGIERARIYLKKVAKMSFPDTLGGHPNPATDGRLKAGHHG